MISWLFIPTWSVIVLLLVGIGWIVWNFDNEIKDKDEEIASLRNRVTKLEGKSE